MSNDINLNADGDLSAGDVTGRDKIVGDQINQFNAAQNIYNITITLAPQFARESRSEDELKILWRQATNKYTDRIFNELGQIQILGQPHPKPLVEVFTDVYTHPRPTSWQRFNPDELEKQFERHGRFGRRDDLERFNALEVARLNSRLFLLGKPGSGKTTLLKYLAIQAADSKEENRVMPIFVPLRDLARSTQHKTLFEYIRDLFKSSGFPAPTRFARQLLSSGRALVMLDGLDEVSVENDLRGELSDSIQAFVREFYQSRFIISSRTAATEYMFEGFYYIEMADFSEEQTTLFIKQWFAGEHETADMFLDEINKAENRGIRELAQSPLLLTLLSLHFDVALNFPRERSEIYESALRVLFEKWDASRRISRRKRELEQHGVHYKSLTTKRKEQLMSRIASKAFEIGRIFFPQAWLEDEIVDFLSKVPPRPPKDEIEGELVLKAMESQHGLLIQRARRVYSFSHLTFQEYFTARYIVDHIGIGSIEDLVTIPKISTPRWHEVFRLTAGLLPDADYFFLLFTEALKSLAGSDPSLKNFIRWAGRKSQETIGNQQAHVDARFRYIGLARDFVRALDLVRDILMLSEKEALATNLKLDLKEVIEVAARESDQLSWREMVIGLENLTLPADDARSIAWHNFHTDLISILDELVFLGNRWEFKQEQVDIFINWLNGHSLLYTCLDRAIVTSREAVETELFLVND